MAVDVDTADRAVSSAEAPDPGDEHELNADPATADGAAVSTERPRARAALAAGMVMVAALTALLSWLSYGAYQAHQTDQQRRAFLQVGRRAALNLTTIDYTHVDADVARILDCSTGAFRDEFQRRSQPFIEAVKKAQAKSTGSLAEAALESVHGDEAQVLVAVQVKTSVPGVSDQAVKGWRMRVELRRTGSDIKMSNVTFVT